MRRLTCMLGAGVCLLLLRAPTVGAADAAAARIEARSADLLAVGLVHGDAISIHLSRLIDNAAIRDATVTVVLRGGLYPTVAQADGGYSLRTPELALPGTAAVEFRVLQGQSREELKGELVVAEGQADHGEKNSARQLGWWVLNFAVCSGFLVLWSKRSKAAKAREAAAPDPP